MRVLPSGNIHHTLIPFTKLSYVTYIPANMLLSCSQNASGSVGLWKNSSLLLAATRTYRQVHERPEEDG